jgi:cell division protease FtsH
MRPAIQASLLVLLLLLGFLVAVIAAGAVDAAADSPSTVAWSRFKHLVEEGALTEVTVEGEFVRGAVATGREAEVGASGSPATVQAVAVPGDDGLIPLLEAHGVPYRALPSPPGCGLGGAMLGMLLLASAWALLARPNVGAPPGVSGFGRAPGRIVAEEGTGVRFKDVAGVDEAREELQEIVQFLRTPERFTRLGGRIPKGVLLVGPPGTGKTLLARAVAGEAGVPFFNVSGSAFVEMFVGVGAARVRDLFRQALERAPCILFIDELDAIGKARGVSGPLGGHDEREQTLNQLLVEMDGFDARRGVVVMAATNRPEILDPALLRAGRFDRHVVVDRPDRAGREAILRVHARALTLGQDVDLAEAARRTPGFAGADLANALNEAALLAARRGQERVAMADVDEAIERLVAGHARRSRRLTDAERRAVAVHEAGHAVVATATPGADPVHKVSILRRGAGVLGATFTLPDEERTLAQRHELRGRLVVLYGGRAAEEMLLDDISSGAADDIRKATDLAQRMVTELGMSEAIGPCTIGGPAAAPGGLAPSEETAATVDGEVRHMLDLAYGRARALVRRHRSVVGRLAEALVDRETLDGTALASFLDEVRAAEGSTRAGQPEPAGA